MGSNHDEKMSYIYNSQLDAFTLYHISSDTSSHSTIGPALPALGHATSGAAGTAIAKLLTYPLDLIITRLQVQRQLKRDGKHAHYTGFLDAIETIYEREGGLAAFYSGVGPEIVKGVADSFLFFLAYSYVRQQRLVARGTGKSLPALEEIGVGVVAGAFSKFWTTPIQQIVTRKQTAAMLTNPSSSVPPLSNTANIAREILREKGLQGFWSGYSASLVLTLNPSITMLLHKMLLRLLVPRSRRDDPGARITFFLAAISKAMASTVTYPFSLAKTRAQVSSQKPSSTIGEISEKNATDGSFKSKGAQARQRTVFSTIFHIVEEEGIWGLYQGLGPEVLKGFFSHGITMLMKDRIHTAIVSLYYAVLKAFQKFPSQEKLTKRASEGASDLYEQGKEKVNGAYEKGVDVAEQATEKVRYAVAAGSQRASGMIESGKQQASDAYAKGSELSKSTSSRVQDAVASGSEQASGLVDRAKDVASNATQQTVAAVETSKDAVSNAELLQQAKGAASEHAEGAAATGRDAASHIGQRVGQAVRDADVKDINGPDATASAGDQVGNAVRDADVKDINGPDSGIKE